MLDSEPTPVVFSCAGRELKGPKFLQVNLLAHKYEKDRLMYDVAGVDPMIIKNFLQDSEGDNFAWINNELISKSSSLAKCSVSSWLHDLSRTLRWSGWAFFNNLHVVGGDGRWFLPQYSAYFRPQRKHSSTEILRAGEGNALPNLAVEVEYASEIDQVGTGFRQAHDLLFPLEGPDSTHIKEIWVVNIPDDLSIRRLPIVALPVEQQPFAVAVTERPPPTALLLALLTRAKPPQQGGVVRAYYVLQANEVFRAPEYSVLSVHGPAGPPGAPDLPVNDLLVTIGFRFIST